MALAGGVLAVALSGGVLSLSSILGFLAVVGIAIRNGIVMTSHYQHLEDRDGESFGPELVLRGAGDRLTPILTTTFAVILMLVPFVLAGDTAGIEVVRPMAIVVLGGLITTALLDLFVLPVLYLRFGAKREPVMELVPEPAAAN
jgi:Cu/Ag efflux pump CusA